MIRRTAILGMLLIICGGIARSAVAAAPNAVITPVSLDGMAPFTVHAHALNSSLGSGDALTTHFAWEFGDPAGAYNELVGWNAAHTYDAPGAYTIVLTVTNQDGESSRTTATVHVAPDTRRIIYVSAAGSDGADGSSPTQAVRTYARGLQLLDNDATLLLRRGDVFNVDDSHGAPYDNCVIGAYGEGAAPELRWIGGLGDSTMLALTNDNCRNIVVQDIRFDSRYANLPDRDICDAIRPGTLNITVRRCFFGHVTMGLNTNMQPTGVLSYDNHADGVRAYYLWGQGADHTHIGNTVTGSLHEHDIRFGGIERVLIANNTLTNSPKRTLWSMAGEYAYITGNIMHDGRVTVGPDHLGGAATNRFKWCVIEKNFINKTSAETSALEVEPGAEHVMIRNNIIQTVGDSSISVNGYLDTYDRTTIDIRIFNNTGVLSGSGGRFLKLLPGGETMRVANNLFVAPNIVTGDNRCANVYIEEPDLAPFVFIQDNVWSEPADMELVDDAYHYVWRLWPNLNGFRSVEEWAAFPQTNRELYAQVVLNEHYAPAVSESVAVGHGRPVAGVFTDFYGNTRPSGDTWTAGAVEFGSTGPGNLNPCPWDLTGDFVVGLGDLTAFLSNWGPCPAEGSCAWDFNRDGQVALSDLNEILSNWGPCFTNGGGDTGGGGDPDGDPDAGDHTDIDGDHDLNDNPGDGSGSGVLP